jgi:hypothetical protein
VKQVYEQLMLGKDNVGWPRKTGDKAWVNVIYNSPITFGEKPSPKLIKLISTRRWAEYEGPWSRVRLKRAVYNRPAFPQRILSDEELINRSARAGRSPLIWQFRERAFLRAWDLQNNGSTRDIGGLFMSILSNEVLACELHVSHNLFIAERVASEIVSWLGSPTGTALINQGRRATQQPLLAAWDFYNNSVANAANPLLVRLLSDETKEEIEEYISQLFIQTNGWRIAEIMAASLMAWLDTEVGGKFVTEVLAEADAEAQRARPEIHKLRLLFQSVGEIPQPSDYEKGLIKKEE